MKKLLFVLGATGMLVGATVACGGDDEGGSGGGSGSPVQGILDKIPNADVTNGESVYTSLCGTSSCHGPNGDDGAANAGDLPNVVPTLSDEDIAIVIVDGQGAMPPQSQLDEQTIADVIAYLNQTF
jgi:mono/diheme cytochrome c family protein